METASPTPARWTSTRRRRCRVRDDQVHATRHLQFHLPGAPVHARDGGSHTLICRHGARAARPPGHRPSAAVLDQDADGREGRVGRSVQPRARRRQLAQVGRPPRSVTRSPGSSAGTPGRVARDRLARDPPDRRRRPARPRSRRGTPRGARSTVSCSSAAGGRAIPAPSPGRAIRLTVSAKSWAKRSSGSTGWSSPSTSTSVAWVASST